MRFGQLLLSLARGKYSMSVKKATIDELISAYNTNHKTDNKTKNTELEIRVSNVSRDLFYESMKAAITNANVTKSHIINIYPENNTGNFATKVGDEITYHDKTPIADTFVNNGVKLKISLSVEKDGVGKFPIDKNSTVRFKNRISVEIDIGGVSWRLDLTQIHKSKLSIVNTILKNNFFTAELSETAPVLVTDYSIELEYLGKKDISRVQIEEAQKKLLQLMGTNHQLLASGLMKVKSNELLDIHKIINGISLSGEEAKRLTIKTVGNKAISLMKLSYREIWPLKNMLITEKADGVRKFATFSIETQVAGTQTVGKFAIIDEKETIIYNFTSTAASAESSPFTNSTNSQFEWLFDGEFIVGGAHSGTSYFLIFDVIVAEGKNVADEGLLARIAHAGDFMKLLQSGSMTPADLVIRPKIYINVDSTNIEESVKAIMGEKYEYEVDGIIFSTSNHSYVDTKNYKWKPKEKLTIDFLAKKCPTSLLGKIPYTNVEGKILYILFC